MKNKLFEEAKKIAQNAHCPYSGFPVGVAILSETGDVFVGCNVENAAYPSGWCAETSAIASMVAAGKKEIKEICVVAPTKNETTPCGNCRQQIAEFATKDTLVHLSGENGVVRTVRLDELLPEAFGLK